MTFLSGNLVFELVSVAVALIAVAVAFFKWKFSYWKKTGLETLNPTIPFGDTKSLLLGQETFGETFKKFYDIFKAKGLRHGGIYLALKPFYIPVDLEIVKCIMQKDFQHFVNHGTYFNELHDPLAGHLFNLEDAKWKNMRMKLTPTFTSGKMKMMFHTLADCAVGLNVIMNESAINKTPVDIKDILARFTTDIIGSCAFGIDCNSIKDPESKFRKAGRRVFENTKWELFKTSMMFALPRSVLDFIKLKTTKNDVEEFFLKVVEDTVDYREKNKIYRKDFMHLLLQLKNRGSVADDGQIFEDGTIDHALTLNELAAQAFVFFLAGFETSSTTMTFTLFELASNPDIQNKLRKEIQTVLAKHDGKLTYDAIMDMTYMDKVLSETLRKYPPVPFLFRVCTKDYIIPETSVLIQKGTDIGISALGIHNDPEYYPNPEKFDPERFSEEEKNKRPAFAWLPFGEGPRICIGLRFGLMQAKVGLTTIVQNYKISINNKTKVPLVMEKLSFITTADGGVWLDVQKNLMRRNLHIFVL